MPDIDPEIRDVTWDVFLSRFEQVFSLTKNANASVNMLSLFYGLKMSDDREDWQK